MHERAKNPGPFSRRASGHGLDALVCPRAQRRCAFSGGRRPGSRTVHGRSDDTGTISGCRDAASLWSPVVLLALAVPGAAVPATSHSASTTKVLAPSFVAIDAATGRVLAARGANDAAADRLADEGDDGAHRDRTRESRRAGGGHACRHERRALSRGPRRRTRLHARDAALVGAPRVGQRLRNSPRDRRRRRLPGRLLRARQRRRRRRSE